MPDMIRTVMVEQKMMYEEQIAQLRAERDEARLASVRFMEKMADILMDEANAEIEQLLWSGEAVQFLHGCHVGTSEGGCP